MSAFWTMARRMLRQRGTLAAAITFAFLSAGGLGAGILAIAPMLRLILDQDSGKSLPDLARDFNAADHIISIPDWLVQALPEGRLEGVFVVVLAICILAVLGATAIVIHQFLSMTVTTRTIAGIRQEAFERVLMAPLGRVTSRGPTEYVARIVRDAAELQRGFLALTGKTVAQTSHGIVAFIVALVVAPRLVLIAVVAGPILFTVLRKLGKRIQRGSRGAMKAQENLLRIASESLQGLRAVKVNTAEHDALQRFDRQNQQVIREELRMRTARMLSSSIVEVLAVFTVGILAIWAARQIIAGTMNFEQFVVALGGLATVGISLRPLTGLINEIQAAEAPAARLLEILGETPEVQAIAPRRALPRHARTIEFRNVAFTYPGADHPALLDVSLTIDHGEKVAIVGPNGSGKTTLLSLIPRLHQPDRGSVLIDGVDIATVDLPTLRRQIGVVTQETVLFRGTIAENIAFGLEGVDRDSIIEAARRAHADEFIRRIPSAYDADVFEQGASLSGGQRQRLAIARAMLRDPALLILDEATSQIDAESESHINQALAEFCQGRTAIIIAHRLSTVISADRIAVMDDGRIVDEGSHEELLGRCELYQRLARTQLVGG
jgi:ABC-type multidrug transport system fused ATPase/permease subunit